MPSDARDEPTHSFLSPFRAFLVLVVLLIAAGALLLATLSDDEAPSTNVGPTTTDFSLTDTEAVARFMTLRELAFEAIEQRDVSLFPSVFTDSGPTGRRASEEIRRLLRDGVVDLTRVEFLGVQVISNTKDEVHIRETSRLYPCFVTEAGKDVTKSPAVIESESVWTLKREGATWLLHDAVVEKDRVIGNKDAAC